MHPRMFYEEPLIYESSICDNQIMRFILRKKMRA